MLRYTTRPLKYIKYLLHFKAICYKLFSMQKEKNESAVHLGKLSVEGLSKRAMTKRMKKVRAHRWTGKSEAERKAQGAKLTAGRAKARLIRQNSAS